MDRIVLGFFSFCLFICLFVKLQRFGVNLICKGHCLYREIAIAAPLLEIGCLYLGEQTETYLLKICIFWTLVSPSYIFIFTCLMLNYIN